MSALSGLTQLVAGSVQSVPGWAEPIKLPDPGAGVLTLTRTIPGNTWERVLTARATFTADATVGTRNPRWEVVAPDGTVLHVTPVSTGVVASNSVKVSLSLTGTFSRAATGETQERIPELILQSGYVVRFAVDALGAGDAWSGGVLYVARYSTDTSTYSE
jgi:hypothetical protein